METGGYDVTFIDDVADYLQCVVCQLVLRDPVLFIDCGHRLCQSCFEDMKRYAEDRNIQIVCPHDRNEVDVNKVFEDKGIARAVMDLKVKCHHFVKGCVWTGELRNLQTHTKENCHFEFEEKKNVSQLLSECMKCMESCEKRLNEKDRQMLSMQKELKESQAKEKDASQRINQLMKRMDEKDKQVETLQEELTRTQEELHQFKKKTYETTKGAQVPQKKSLSNKEFSDQLESLKMHVMNVVEYVPHQHTVFEWELQNYAYYQDDGEQLYSPMFYSRPAGHCCRLSLIWYGERKGRLGVFLHICQGVYEEVPTATFNITRVTFETFDKHGELRSSDKPIESFDDIWDAFIIGPGEDTSVGFGDAYFLNMPSLRNYVIGDVLTINCTLYVF